MSLDGYQKIRFVEGRTTSREEQGMSITEFDCTDPECGCKRPVFTEAYEALRFLSGRFKHAGVADIVALSYARDIDAILARQSTPAVEVTADAVYKIATEAVCVARNEWGEKHEETWLETDDNHPDEFIGKAVADAVLAAALRRVQQVAYWKERWEASLAREDKHGMDTFALVQQVERLKERFSQAAGVIRADETYQAQLRTECAALSAANAELRGQLRAWEINHANKV